MNHPCEKEVGGRIGKIIAVHLSYPSRAAQRGRTPKEASYFMKATSSLASSGTAYRPANCELLVFEGEVAAIIGTAARNVSEEEAWNHVGWIAAANDMGLLDMRAADKGSNVRSKSGDGMTPLSPTLIDARKVNPQAIGIRTWVNGNLAQEDSTSTLLFSIGHFIADLSRFMTLEPGDVILTGTPAGSSVIGPGQEVRVEVFSEEDPSLSSSVTTTVEEAPAVAAIGSMPNPTTRQRIDAWGSPEAAGIKPLLTDDIRERLSRLAVATISSQLRKRGYPITSIDGVHPMLPGQKIVGTARTLRYIAHRPDLFKAKGGGFNAQKRAVDTINPGEVLVMEARGIPEAGTCGDVLALRAKVRGAAGIITDGAARDWAAVADIGLPVFCAGAHPSVLGRVHVPWETDVTITCGGTPVQVGDVIVGDDDGAVVIPPQLLMEVLEASEQQEVEELFIAEKVAEGASVDGLFPLTAKWRPAFEEWLAKRND